MDASVTPNRHQVNSNTTALKKELTRWVAETPSVLHMLAKLPTNKMYTPIIFQASLCLAFQWPKVHYHCENPRRQLGSRWYGCIPNDDPTLPASAGQNYLRLYNSRVIKNLIGRPIQHQNWNGYTAKDSVRTDRVCKSLLSHPPEAVSSDTFYRRACICKGDLSTEHSVKKNNFE